jgi:hypothetical protein
MSELTKGVGVDFAARSHSHRGFGPVIVIGFEKETVSNGFRLYRVGESPG